MHDTSPAIMMPVMDDPSHIDIRNLSSAPDLPASPQPSPDWASYYPQLSLPRVSIIKLDSDDAGQTRTKIEERESRVRLRCGGDKMTSRQREMDDGGGHW